MCGVSLCVVCVECQYSYHSDRIHNNYEGFAMKPGFHLNSTQQSQYSYVSFTRNNLTTSRHAPPPPPLTHGGLDHVVSSEPHMADIVEYVEVTLSINLIEAHIDGDKRASTTHSSTTREAFQSSISSQKHFFYVVN